MLLVTLGTVEYPFQRPINWIKRLADQGGLRESIFIQHGVTKIDDLSQNPAVKTASLIPQSELVQLAKRARLVVTHGGDGSIRLFSKLGVSFVVIPRLADYGEHADNHQLQLLDSLGLYENHACLTFGDLQQYLQYPPKATIEKRLSNVPPLSQHLAQAYPAS